MGLPDLGKAVGAGNLDRVGVAALGKQPLPLGLTDPELLGQVGLGTWLRCRRLGGSWLIRRGHDLPA